MVAVRRPGAWIGILAAILLVGSANAYAQSPVSASVGSNPSGQAMGPGFVGVSLEYKALHVYTGRDPTAVNPVLVNLLRGLTPAQSPVLRIGGDSADVTWWPVRGMLAPPGISYSITPGWLRTTKALAAATRAQMIMDLNLASGRPAVAAAEARAFMQGIGRRYLQAFEIGNEPDLYPYLSWYRDRLGKAHYSRGRSYTVNAFIRDFSRWRAALPNLPVAGPAFAHLPWLDGMGHFLATEPRLRLVTVHRYPLRAPVTDPTAPDFASIANLLSDSSSSGLAQQVGHYVTMAHAAHHPFRIGEMNSAAGGGKWGTSNTFASALWVLDTLFNFAGAGVDGVNVHSLPRAAYELFTFTHSGPWSAFVHPEYYGMLMFAQAFPPGGRLLPVTAPSGPLKVWAVQTADGHTQVAVINKDPAGDYQVRLQLPGAEMAGQASLEWLKAPSVSSTGGVTLGGQTFGDRTTSGTLGPPQLQPVLSVGGSYPIDVPPASAVLLRQ
jgi:hypothetical protein